MKRIFNTMKAVKVEFYVKIPEEIDGKVVNPAHIDEWIRFEIGADGQMSCENPLMDHPLEPNWQLVTIKHEIPIN